MWCWIGLHDWYELPKGPLVFERLLEAANAWSRDRTWAVPVTIKSRPGTPLNRRCCGCGAERRHLDRALERITIRLLLAKKMGALLPDLPVWLSMGPLNPPPWAHRR